MTFQTITKVEDWLLARGWLYKKDPYYGESWQKGDHVAVTAAGAREYELDVLSKMPRKPTPRGWGIQQHR